jgi:hypothetical protein
MSEERELRRVSQAEHGEAAVAGDEADGEHAPGAVLLKFLGCALLFGWVASVGLCLATLPLLNRIPIWRVRAVARRVGKERFKHLFDEAQAAPPGAPSSPELAAVREQVQAAACASGFTVHRVGLAVKIAGWALGAVISWIIFYG